MKAHRLLHAIAFVVATVCATALLVAAGLNGEPAAAQTQTQTQR